MRPCTILSVEGVLFRFHSDREIWIRMAPWSIAGLLGGANPLAHVLRQPPAVNHSLCSVADINPLTHSPTDVPVLRTTSDVLRTTSRLSLPARLAELDAKINPFLDRTWVKSIRPTHKEISGDFHTDMPKMIALRNVARQIQALGSMGFSEAATLFHDHRAAFCDDLAKAFPGLPVSAPETLQPNRLRAEVFGRLPLVKMPWRSDGQAGVEPALLLPNLPGVADDDLAAQCAPVLALLDQQQATAVPGEALSEERLRLIKNAMPSETSAWLDYAIIKAAGTDTAARLGISLHRQETLSARLDRQCTTTLPDLLLKAEAATLAAARKGGTTRAAILHQFRQQVTKTGALKDRSHATEEALYKTYPELLEVARAAVRANVGSPVVYKSGETPVDEMLLKKEMRGAGSVHQRVCHILNGVFADRNLSLSVSATQTILKHAGVRRFCADKEACQARLEAISSKGRARKRPRRADDDQ